MAWAGQEWKILECQVDVWTLCLYLIFCRIVSFTVYLQLCKSDSRVPFFLTWVTSIHQNRDICKRMLLVFSLVVEFTKVKQTRIISNVKNLLYNLVSFVRDFVIKTLLSVVIIEDQGLYKGKIFLYRVQFLW